MGLSYSSGLKDKGKLEAFVFWKACIFSGFIVKIEFVEGVPVSMGYCRKVKRWVDFEIECPICKKRKTVRAKPKHVRTPTRKARIGTTRRRSIAKSRDLFEMKQNRKRGTKKH